MDPNDQAYGDLGVCRRFFVCLLSESEFAEFKNEQNEDLLHSSSYSVNPIIL